MKLKFFGKILFCSAVLASAIILLLIISFAILMFTHGLMNIKSAPFFIEKPNDINALSSKLYESPYWDFGKFIMIMSGDIITIKQRQ